MIAAAVMVGLPGPAIAYAMAPTPTPSPSGSAGQGAPAAGPATPGTGVCTISNTGLNEITGMVATAKGIYAVQGGHAVRPDTVVVWTVNASTCQATSEDHGFYPVDPQDLAIGSDGALWIADIGAGVGGENIRPRVALERVEMGGTKPAVPYRALYPDSGKFHAEAMLLDGHDNPIIIAQQSGKGILYTPDRPLVPDIETGLPKLTKVGEFVPAKTGTANPLGEAGQARVTGAAKSPDGSRVVIRTASDAYEFAVGADGNIVKAITEGTPLITPLPGEENGTAISYSVDGASFLTLSASARPVLRRYAPYRPPPPASTGAQVPRATSDQGPLQKPSLSQLTRIVAAAGVVGVVVTIAGILGIRRARRRREEEDGYDDGSDDYDAHARRRRGQRRPRAHDDGYRDDQPAPAGYPDDRYAGDEQAGHDQAPAGPAGYNAAGSEPYAGRHYGGQPEHDPYAQQRYGAGYSPQHYADAGGQPEDDQQDGWAREHEVEVDPFQNRRHR